MFGNPETTTGGNALKYYASVRLDIRQVGQIKDNGNNVIGNRVKVKVAKNKLAPPFKTTRFDILYGKGISKMGELIDLGVDLGVLQKSGSWYSYGKERLGQGREAVIEIITLDKDLQYQLEKEIQDISNRSKKGE